MKERRLTVRGLAKALDCAAFTVSRWKSADPNLRSKMSLTQWIRFCSVYGDTEGLRLRDNPGSQVLVSELSQILDAELTRKQISRLDITRLAVGQPELAALLVARQRDHAFQIARLQQNPTAR